MVTLKCDLRPIVLSGPDGVYEPDFNINNDLSLYTSQAQAGTAARTLMSGQSRRKILAALDAIDFVQVSQVAGQKIKQKLTT